jgi:serine/threonine-protein kinase
MAKQVIGKYEILEKRGEGGFGILYKAMDTMIERVVALKVLHPQYASNERLSAWFRREAKAMARLNHPNIVTIHSFEIVGDQHFIVMEYVEGDNLGEVLDQRGPLPIEDSTSVVLQMVDALAYAHANGIVHRDVKPSNVMIDSSAKVKITDFGIAKILGDTKLTRTGTGAGSIHYMSPEQIEGNPIDMRTDIYSLGITFYQMITGKVPFTDESEFVVMRAHLDQQPTSPSQLQPDTPPELERVILKMLEKKPEDRYDSMTVLDGELRRLSCGSARHRAPVDADAIDIGDRKTRPFAPPPEAPEPETGRRGRSRMPLVIGAALLVMVAALASIVAFLGKSEDTSGDSSAADSSDAVLPESAAVDGAVLQDGVAGVDTVSAEETTPVVQQPVYEGKLLLDISPFDYRNRPRVVFAGEETVVEDVPFEIAGIKAGWHRIRVRYREDSFVEDIYVNNDTQTRSYKFNGPTGRVSIGAEFIGQEKQPWAEIVVDDKPIAQGTPASLELVEGPHEILVRKDGYELVSGPKIVYAKAGENTMVNFKLRRK